MAAVEFWFDYGSAASYLAYTQMAGLAKRTGATVLYKPMLLGAVFKATGNRSPVEVPAKGRWIIQDLGRFAARYGVPFRLNPHFPINTLMLMRGAVAAQQLGCFAPYSDAVFKAIWDEGANMGDPAVAGGVLAKAGIDVAKLFAAANEQPVKDALRDNTEAAIARGVFGAPTYFIGDVMHFGQDRLDFVEAALREVA